MSDDLDFEMEVVEDDETGLSKSNGEQKVRRKKNKAPVSDWEEVQLNEVVHRRSENVDPSRTELDRHVGLEHISSGDPSPDFGSIEGQSSTKRHFLPGDVLFGKLRPYLEKVAQPDFEGLCTSEIFSIVAEEAINAKFLLYRLSSKRAVDYAVRTSIGTRMPRTSWGLFENFEFELPPLPEQRKIASVLYAVDQAIQKTEAIIEQAKRVKRGLMQDLLSLGIKQNGKLRDHDLEQDQFRDTKLGSLPKVWKVFPMGKTLEMLYRYPSYYDIDYVESGVPEVRGEMLRPDGAVEIDGEEIRHVTEETASEYPRVRLEENDFVMSVRGTVGKVGRIPLSLAGGVITANLIRIKFDAEVILPNYAQLVLLSPQFQKRLDALTSATTIKTIKSDDLRRIPIRVPSLEEQKRISNVVHAHTERIWNNKNYLGELRKLKKGLMQDLLTGEVRTADKAIEVLEEVQAHG